MDFLRQALEKIRKSGEESRQDLAKLGAKVYEGDMPEEEAIERAKRLGDIAAQGSTMIGSLGVVRSPEAAALLRARQAMTPVDPMAQKQLVQKLSSIEEAPLKLLSGETIYPRSVLEKFKKNIGNQ